MIKKETRRRKNLANTIVESDLPRLYIAEHQEFVIEGRIFTWYYGDPILKTNLIMNLKGAIVPEILSITVS